MIAFTYARGKETNYSWAKDEKEFERNKNRLEKKGWKVVKTN